MGMSYPTVEQFGEAAMEVAAKLRGNANVDGVRAAWVCLGYGLSFTQGQPAVMAAAAMCPTNAEDQATCFESAARAATPSDKEARVSAVPWALILSLAQQLLQQWLASR